MENARPIAAIFCCACCLLSSQALWSQEFASIDGDLLLLERLIADSLQNTEEQQKLLESLQQNLSESGSLIENYESITSRQERLLEDLQARLNEMSETYRKQSALSAKYAKSSKFWRTFTLIAVPVAAALSGGLAFAATR
jgi:ElaB/YqjD/DUF883 family membrane-anchored ribosome-binding protein